MSELFEIDNLQIQARKEDGTPIPIVKGVSFKVKAGQVVALIGESGSGKSTISLATMAYCRPGLEFPGGEVRLHGKDVLSMDPQDQRALRGNNVAYLAQSAAATFNPAFTIGRQVTEAMLSNVLNAPIPARPHGNGNGYGAPACDAITSS